MKIVADRNLVLTSALLPANAELLRLEGREIRAEHVKDADALLIRSVTSVDEPLLSGSSVRFVGTATSGEDHIDKEYLANSGVTFRAAPGCNADAVVDYCMATLAYAALHLNVDPIEAKIGIVGLGQVGGRLLSRLRALGCNPSFCDPPLAESSNPELEGDQFSSLEEISRCHIVSLHVPLTESGPMATARMIGENFLSALPENALLINSCRGEVVDEEALLARLESGHLHAAIDVWANEPDINAELASHAAIATPHIAGYSRLAKTSAARQIIEELWAFAVKEGYAKTEMPEALSDESELDEIETFQPAQNYWQSVLNLLPVQTLSKNFHRSIAAGEGATAFDALRQQLTTRKEFREYQFPAALQASVSDEQLQAYKALGIQFP